MMALCDEFARADLARRLRADPETSCSLQHALPRIEI